MEQKPGTDVWLPYGMRFSQADLDQIKKLAEDLQEKLWPMISHRASREMRLCFPVRIHAEGTIMFDAEADKCFSALGLPADLRERTATLSFTDALTHQKHKFQLRISEAKIVREQCLEIYFANSPLFNLGDHWGIYYLGPLQLSLPESLGGSIENCRTVWSLTIWHENEGRGASVSDIALEIL